MQITRQADYAVRAVLYLSRIGENQRAATLGQIRRGRSLSARVYSVRALSHIEKWLRSA